MGLSSLRKRSELGLQQFLQKNGANRTDWPNLVEKLKLKLMIALFRIVDRVFIFDSNAAMLKCALSQLTSRKEDPANGEIFAILDYITVFFFGNH